jgi:hypothetical protein
MIGLREIITACDSLDIFEKRYDSEEYCELVFFLKDIDVWVKNLSDFLDLPLKPVGVKPTDLHHELTEPYGGIRSDQTLFCKDFAQEKIIVMFWPWNDKVHVTLRMVRVIE